MSLEAPCRRRFMSRVRHHKRRQVRRARASLPPVTATAASARIGALLCRDGIGLGAHASAATGVRDNARARTAVFIVAEGWEEVCASLAGDARLLVQVLSFTGQQENCT